MCDLSRIGLAMYVRIGLCVDMKSGMLCVCVCMSFATERERESRFEVELGQAEDGLMELFQWRGANRIDDESVRGSEAKRGTTTLGRAVKRSAGGSTDGDALPTGGPAKA